MSQTNFVEEHRKLADSVTPAETASEMARVNFSQLTSKLHKADIELPPPSNKPKLPIKLGAFDTKA